MSKTLANKLLEVFSLSSSSRMRLVIMMVLRVMGLPGRCIRNSHGSHWRNKVRTCNRPEKVLTCWIHSGLGGGNYPCWHVMRLRCTMMVIQDYDCKHHRGGHHHHDAVEVGA